MRGTIYLLRVETNYFVAGAVWQKIYGVWSCIKAAPMLHWMVGKDRDTVKLALAKMGARYEWVAVRDSRAKENGKRITESEATTNRLTPQGAGASDGRNPVKGECRGTVSRILVERLRDGGGRLLSKHA